MNNEMRPTLKPKLQRMLILCLISAGMSSVPFVISQAHADSCWDHNGSLMRLQAEGNQRWMYYEIPREGLRDSGVKQGTLLFNGQKDGNWYSGTARRFSRYCIGDPLEYFVEGPVRQDQLQVTVTGMREVYKQCNPTGKLVRDELIFTYVRNC